MTTKEALKNAIENLSDQEAKRLHQYLADIKSSKKGKNRQNIPSLKLDGILDDKDIRTQANK